MTQMNSQQVYELDNDLISDAAKIRFFPIVVERGEGARLYDVDGKSYLDFSAGWALANVGYNHSHVRNAVIKQLHRSLFTGLTSGLHEPAVELAQKLISLTPGDFDKKVWFGLSGSDANETVGRLLPMATHKRRLVTFIGGYHGTTGTSIGMSAHISMTSEIGGANVVKVPYPQTYRCPFGDNVGDSARMAINFLQDYIFKTICPPEDVAGIIVEAVQSDGGDIVPPPEFLPMLEEVCRRNNIYLVLDEVKVGMGRTGKMFAFDHSDITPDVVVLGKPLGGGLPLSAVVARREILDHGFALFTASGNALGCVAGLAAIEAIEQDNLVENSRKVGGYLRDRLEELADKHPLIGDVRGLGMFQGVELVKNRDTKDPAPVETAKVVYRAFELGLLVFYVGMFSNVLEITPPLVMTQMEVDEGIAILDTALTDVQAGRVSDEIVAPFAGWS